MGALAAVGEFACAMRESVGRLAGQVRVRTEGLGGTLAWVEGDYGGKATKGEGGRRWRTTVRQWEGEGEGLGGETCLLASWVGGPEVRGGAAFIVGQQSSVGVVAMATAARAAFPKRGGGPRTARGANEWRRGRPHMRGGSGRPVGRERRRRGGGGHGPGACQGADGLCHVRGGR